MAAAFHALFSEGDNYALKKKIMSIKISKTRVMYIYYLLYANFNDVN